MDNWKTSGQCYEKCRSEEWLTAKSTFLHYCRWNFEIEKTPCCMKIIFTITHHYLCGTSCWLLHRLLHFGRKKHICYFNKTNIGFHIFFGCFYYLLLYVCMEYSFIVLLFTLTPPTGPLVYVAIPFFVGWRTISQKYPFIMLKLQYVGKTAKSRFTKFLIPDV